MSEIRNDCCWYRPWQDMGATLAQCYWEEPTYCSCTDDCWRYISQEKAEQVLTKYMISRRLGEVD